MDSLLGFLKKHWLLLVALVAIAVYIAYLFLMWDTGEILKNRGKFGDSFGAVSALFAGLAFVILLYTMLLQKTELELQREALQGQNKTLQKQNKTLQKQNKTLQKQNKTLQKQDFGRAFFQLLGLHNEIVNSIELVRNIDRKEVTYSGRECFSRMSGELERDEWESYKDFFDKSEFYIGRYLRHLYSVIKFVDESDITEKSFYVSLIRAQLSTDELRVLSFYKLSEQGADFKDMMDRYNLSAEDESD